MKSYRIIAAFAALAAFCACQKTVIKGTLTDGPDSEIIVELLDVNRLQALDTVKTDASGAFKYDIDVEKGKPEFVYLFHGDNKFASLLVEKGDIISVTSDTLGKACTVEGSEESLKLAQIEKDFADFQMRMAALGNRFVETGNKDLQKEISRTYIDYYRRAVSYILNNSHSLTSIPVLYQQVDEGFPVFGNRTDAIHFRSVADSLKTVYPESKYVKALEKEAAKRMNVMEMSARIEGAEEIGYIDIELPDINGQKVKLSDVAKKLTLIYFWAATDDQKMFNIDYLGPLYEKYHDKGLEIFAVSFDVDKTDWASVVRAQKMPWINVCDVRGNQSPLIGYYAINGLPSFSFIYDGELDAAPVMSTSASLEKYIQSKLK